MKSLLTAEVAELLRVTPDRVRDLVQAGRLPAHRLTPRSRLLFDEAEVRAMLRPTGRPDPVARPGATPAG